MRAADVDDRQEHGWRARVRRAPGGGLALKAGALLIGCAFIALGLAAVVLPGPLTIPPVLLGLYVLASEFAWAHALLERAQESAKDAWEKAKQRPVVSSVVTTAGLVAAGVAFWAAGHFDLVARGTDAVGL